MHILRRTTRAPLFCQPKYWSEVHLNALRVTGFGETYALKDVLGQRMICNPSDIHLIKATEEVSLLSYSGRFGKASEKMLKFHKSRPVDGKMEVCIQNMCIEWLKGVRDHVRRYPYIKIG